MTRYARKTALLRGVRHEMCASDEILKRARKLRWIGRVEEAEALLRTAFQDDRAVRPPASTEAR
jgi:hypothetical protein